MADTTNNTITQTYSGRPVDYFMQADGIQWSRPGMSKRALSVKQQQHLSRFESAKAWARRVIADETKAAFYKPYLKRWRQKRKNIGLYHLAIMDFMHPPAILRVSLETPDNAVTVIVDAVNIFQVAGISLEIAAPDGVILEQGEAFLSPYGLHFHYVVGDPSILRPGIIMRVCAWGFPGIAAEKEFNPFL